MPILLHPVWLIFPLMVALVTYWQQQMTVSDPIQARMMLLLPVLAAGFFATMVPVGLSLYWITSSLAYAAEYYLVVGPRGAIPVAQASRTTGGPEVFPQRPRRVKKK